MASCSSKPNKAFIWISQIEKAKSIAKLENDGDFETLSIKVAAGLGEICHGEFLRKVNILEEKARKDVKWQADWVAHL